MNPSLWVAKTGLEAQQLRMQVVSHNLANANTNGFKKGRAIFEDLLYQNMRQVGGQTSQQTKSPTGMHVGTGVRVAATDKIYEQGSVQTTGNAFDMAVNGRGFFAIRLPDGSQAYTRNGQFQINDQGQLVTSSGDIVQPGISVPPNGQGFSVAADGAVTITVNGQIQQLGSIQLTDFINPAGLQPKGENLFTESASSGAPQTGTPGLNGLGRLSQGALESSNVNVVEELVNMIETQRAYEMNSKAIAASDQMLQNLNNISR